MKILLLGNGGREHALAWKISQSPLCDKLYIAPGNAGTKWTGINVEISVNDFEKIASFMLEGQIEMLVVGPEAPLVEGIYDYFKLRNELKHIHIIGPSKNAAQLEGSKSFAKDFMIRHHIPTAAYGEFSKNNMEEGFAFIEKQTPPIVLKADGLAAGKGVLILEDKDEAKRSLYEMIEKQKFGEAGTKVVIEEFLEGIELSVFVLTDGKDYVLLPEAKDYKRIGEGDTGLNTGGMGAVSPVPFASGSFMQKVIERIIEPTIRGLQKDQMIYEGFIFFGLIKVNDEPYVIEYNCRMGDPETEAVLPRIESDIVDLFLKTSTHHLEGAECAFSTRKAGTVILVSGGYPEAYQKGKEIQFPDNADALIFHAGTQEKDHKVLTDGGRVLAITSLSDSLQEALKNSTTIASQIEFENKYYRKDIGYEFT